MPREASGKVHKQPDTNVFKMAERWAASHWPQPTTETPRLAGQQGRYRFDLTTKDPRTNEVVVCRQKGY